ncbi:MAG: hypothetical protein EBQ92_11620 [Proteobacteria bacterium]|nr:hypothetical protein [Pseudomonadota bacterium]
MKFMKRFAVLSVSALILIGFGCGKKDDSLPNPNPAPGVNPTVGNCPTLGGGTALSTLPFEGRLTSTQNWGYNWSNQMSSIILAPAITSTVGYTYQNNNIIASGSITLSELSRLYQNNTIPSACITSPSGAQSGQSSGTFYNGQVSSLVLTGSISVPYYSPFSWQGYPSGAPGTNQTLGQQLIQVIVGSTCPTSFIPSYGNAAGRIRGCISVRMGTQTNSQVLNYQSQ